MGRAPKNRFRSNDRKFGMLSGWSDEPREGNTYPKKWNIPIRFNEIQFLRTTLELSGKWFNSYL